MNDVSPTEPAENDRTAANRRSRRRRTVILSGVAFLVSYVLTAGPAAFIMDKIKLPVVAAIAEIVYSPVILVVKLKIPLLSPLIKGYIGLFQ